MPNIGLYHISRFLWPCCNLRVELTHGTDYRMSEVKFSRFGKRAQGQGGPLCVSFPALLSWTTLGFSHIPHVDSKVCFSPRTSSRNLACNCKIFLPSCYHVACFPVWSVACPISLLPLLHISGFSEANIRVVTLSKAW